MIKKREKSGVTHTPSHTVDGSTVRYLSGCIFRYRSSPKYYDFSEILESIGTGKYVCINDKYSIGITSIQLVNKLSKVKSIHQTSVTKTASLETFILRSANVLLLLLCVSITTSA